MKVKITTDCAVKGEHQSSGVILDLDTAEAKALIYQGRAREYTEEEEKADKAAASKEAAKNAK